MLEHHASFASIVGRTPCRTETSGGGWFRERPQSSGQHQLGNVTQAHTEAVEPDATTDDLRREAIAFVECWSGRPLGHGGIRPDRKRLDNASDHVVVGRNLDAY
jgi:hypothetical protein